MDIQLSKILIKPDLFLFRKNVFQYGNKLEALTDSRHSVTYMQPRLFPYIMQRQLDCFNFSDCSFKMPKTKESTARITLFHQLKIPFVFTLEASFAGASKGKLAG
jgi:hypothetical protein